MAGERSDSKNDSLQQPALKQQKAQKAQQVQQMQSAQQSSEPDSTVPGEQQGQGATGTAVSESADAQKDAQMMMLMAMLKDKLPSHLLEGDHFKSISEAALQCVAAQQAQTAQTS
jgi:hypothetical protein